MSSQCLRKPVLPLLYQFWKKEDRLDYRLKRNNPSVQFWMRFIQAFVVLTVIAGWDYFDGGDRTFNRLKNEIKQQEVDEPTSAYECLEQLESQIERQLLGRPQLLLRAWLAFNHNSTRPVLFGHSRKARRNRRQSKFYTSFYGWKE